MPYCFLSVMTPDRSREIAAFRPDADGRFRLPEAAGADPVLLFAILDGVGRILEHRGAETASDIGGRDVVFVPLDGTSKVSLRCVDDEGPGVRGTFRIERAWGEDFRTEVELETGDDGRAEATLAGSGAFRARLMSVTTRVTHFPRPWDRSFRASPDAPAEVEWVVPRPAEIDVTVVDEDGRPVPDALVGVSTLSDGRFRVSPAGGWSDGGGRVRVAGLDPGDAILRAAVVGRVPVTRRIRLASGVREETARLVSGGFTVSGRFAGSSYFEGRLVKRGVHLLRLGPHADDTFAFFLDLDPGGEFRAEGVPGGEYQLAAPAGVAQRVLVRFTVPDGDVGLGTVDLAPALAEGPLQLHVRVETEPPADPDHVVLNYREASWPPRLWRSQGAWFGQTTLLKDLSEGVYTVRLSTQSQDPDVWDLSATATATLRTGVETPTVVLRARRR